VGATVEAETEEEAVEKAKEIVDGLEHIAEDMMLGFHIDMNIQPDIAEEGERP